MHTRYSIRVISIISAFFSFRDYSNLPLFVFRAASAGVASSGPVPVPPQDEPQHHRRRGPIGPRAGAGRGPPPLGLCAGGAADGGGAAGTEEAEKGEGVRPVAEEGGGGALEDHGRVERALQGQLDGHGRQAAGDVPEGPTQRRRGF